MRVDLGKRYTGICDYETRADLEKYRSSS